MKHYKVNEIFRSIQGEGFWSGAASVFIRFSGCNLDCEWCDTEHEEGILYSGIDLARAASAGSRQGDRLVLTGGEPLLQLDSSLLILLTTWFDKVAIETNGTIDLPTDSRPFVSQKRLWVTVSPKHPDTLDTLPALHLANEFKFIVPGAWTPERLSAFAGMSPHKRLYVQPEADKEGAVQWAIDLVMRDPRWKLSLQLHKILRLR